ncbi:LytR/AlgR family response regulator transcription factor [Mucilaginibacter lappiensis]|uniref:LytR/AlgR family response regulator transcription factor n=1 Tax=Mucilaginibacter lappiensis TaxID=354630 RepID=UPI003D1D9D97
MNILIIEDEMRIARRLARMVRLYFEQEGASLIICDDLQDGLAYLEKHTVELLLLDLNLNGKDGFTVLEAMVSRSFQTIIVSAYTDKAITAFAYGVLDFVPKPFDEERLFRAFKRLDRASPAVTGYELKYLAVRNNGIIKLVNVSDVHSVKGAGNYSELRLYNGNSWLHDKSLDAIERLLPNDQFVRIHRSYIIRWLEAVKLLIEPGGRYSIELKNGEVLPVARSRYPSLRNICL